MKQLLGPLRDPYIAALVSTVVLASILPCRGVAVGWFTLLQNAAICLLFFVHGAKLSRDSILKGSGNWRLHVSVLGSTYVLFPLLGLAAYAAAAGWVSLPLLQGILFLTLLPSTVQSSIAFTAIAGGNVPAAICSASLSNLLGVFITPLLVQLFLGQAGKAMSWGIVETIVLQLLLPFFLGHLSRPWTSGFIGRHKTLTTMIDRGSILLVVYVAFSAAVTQGIWHLVFGARFRRHRRHLHRDPGSHSYGHHARSPPAGAAARRRDRDGVLRLQEKPGLGRADGRHPVSGRHGRRRHRAADAVPPAAADGLRPAGAPVCRPTGGIRQTLSAAAQDGAARLEHSGLLA